MDRLTTTDGLQLHTRIWPVADALGTVLIVHGLGEHIARYEPMAARLNARHWQVAGFDLRGHGRSQGRRGAVSDSESLLKDLAQVIDLVSQTMPIKGGPAPLILLGHSMGGAIAARFAAEMLAEQPRPWQRPLQGLVLSSPAFDPGMRPWQKLLLASVGRLAPDLAVGNGLQPSWISRDPEVVNAYAQDPLVHNRITPRLVRFLLAASASVLQRAPHWRLPTLLLYAGSDRCVSPIGSRAFAAASAGNPAVVSREFAPLFHEIFNEPERNEVYKELETWLQQRSAES
ncbi:alpha/beta hydrolase [Pseudomarimonas arenosa]|uniref:Alpha/beta hydrolase n=1 Tax=Pseudomarimonas arenosa TaxID=2774145 RepID=A0AAW3ZTA2_9GAMM|nr:alpha/beta hydrolase [Pseudomarimonas arenosa]MBD8527406.1 alpha/beta hydrolase [Pseudomarimonas arenosa]